MAMVARIGHPLLKTGRDHVVVASSVWLSGLPYRLPRRARGTERIRHDRTTLHQAYFGRYRDGRLSAIPQGWCMAFEV